MTQRAAVDPHHHGAPSAVAGARRPHVEGEAILALLGDDDAEDRGQRAVGLEAGRTEARGVAHAAPAVGALGRPEAQRTDRWPGERNPAKRLMPRSLVPSSFP